MVTQAAIRQLDVRTMQGTEETPRAPIYWTRKPPSRLRCSNTGRTSGNRGDDACRRSRADGDPWGKPSQLPHTLRAWLGQPSNGRSGEFERFGVEVKTVPVTRVGRPVESTSFPSFIHEELVFESWEDSDLLGRLNTDPRSFPSNAKKGSAQATAVVGRPFFWSPTHRSSIGICEEWEDFRQRISRLVVPGDSRPLPRPSYIHVRPKATRRTRSRPTPRRLRRHPKKSFWLNQPTLSSESSVSTCGRHRLVTHRESVADIALPDLDDDPADGLQVAPLASVAFAVELELAGPELGDSTSGGSGSSAGSGASSSRGRRSRPSGPGRRCPVGRVPCAS